MACVLARARTARSLSGMAIGCLALGVIIVDEQLVGNGRKSGVKEGFLAAAER